MFACLSKPIPTACTFATLAQPVTSMLLHIHELSTWNSTHYTTIGSPCITFINFMHPTVPVQSLLIMHLHPVKQLPGDTTDCVHAYCVYAWIINMNLYQHKIPTLLSVCIHNYSPKLHIMCNNNSFSIQNEGHLTYSYLHVLVGTILFWYNFVYIHSSVLF